MRFSWIPFYGHLVITDTLLCSAFNLSSWKSNLKKKKNSGLNGIRTHDCSSHIWLSYIHIYIFYYHRVYHELTIDHLSMWLGSSVDRALHRYRKVMGSNPVQAWVFFFSGCFFNCLSWKHTARIKFHSNLVPAKSPYIFSTIYPLNTNIFSQ